MANEEFERLIKNRKDWVRSSKENKFDFDSILAGPYNDPSHFIYEMLQNAEDEKATEVMFKLFEDRLDIYHNGKLFDFEDIKGITGIGISTKKGKPDAIGKFGVGFKSVFAVTKTPRIFSGDYKIRIQDFVVPVEEVTDEQVQKTLIRLPFNHKQRPKEDVFNLIHKKLENIGLKTLLFLKNINEIKWQSPSGKGHYVREIKKMPDAKKVIIVSEKDTEEYIVIERPITIENKELKVEVAYKLGKDKTGKEIVIAESDSKLVVFFPTGMTTYLNFIIQGPYKSTPNRADIVLEDERNKAIIEATGCLVVDSLSIIKDLGYLDTNFLSLLPINSEHKKKQIYSVIYEKVKEKFLIDELLPTSDGKYTKAGDALLAGSEKLTEFLNEDDIQILFDKKRWLDTKITDTKTRELRSYLMKELEIPEVDFESFARKITAKFLQTKSDEWMIDFYSRLLDQQSLWSDRRNYKGILRTKPIIRLENGNHVAPFDSTGNVQVYLPRETKTEYETVKRILTENENSLKFLEALGLTKPDLFAEINKKILPKYQKEGELNEEKYFEDFEKLLKAYETVPSNKKREFKEELSRASFIDSVNNVSGANRLQKASETYLNNSDLQDYFDGYNSVYFISSELNEKFGEERLKPFLMDLGVEDKPRRIETKKIAKLPKEEKAKLIGSTGRDVYQINYEYEGLDFLIKEMTDGKSFLLWRMLLKNIEKLSSWDANSFFKDELQWEYNGPKNSRSDANFTKTLRQQAWLFDKKGYLKKPSEITLFDLPDGYAKESSNIDVLKKVLGFKPDGYDQISEDIKERYEITKDIPIEELRKFASTKKEPSIKEEKTWIPEHEPNKGGVPIKEVVPDKPVTPDLTGQGGQEDSERNKQSITKDEKQAEEDVSKTLPDKKAIGKWGEEQVYYNLQNDYREHGAITETDSGFKTVNTSNEEFEIVWLNKHNDKGKGCDFVVKKNGIEIEYIEVKTKTQEDPELIEVTGTQWEFARRLFEQGEGEKYSFYVVLNAGKDNAEIHIRKNPIKLWKEGKLYAHPVNFKL